MSLHDRAQKIVTDLAVVSLWDTEAQQKAIDAIKKLAIDCYDHGLKKTQKWEELPEPKPEAPLPIGTPTAD